MNIQSIHPVMSPATLLADAPLTDIAVTTIQMQRDAISAIIRGEDRRLLVIVGPCSIHDPVASLEYADRLAELSQKLQDRLLLVMRVYFQKPRTILGWKGLIYDPDLENVSNINKGLRVTRQLLLDIHAKNVPIASEFLNPIVSEYIADLISWGAIGARTVESQVHRELASSLSMPIGFKNPTSGDMSVALDAVISARHPHSFLGMTDRGEPAMITTKGNPDAHVVLRGGKSGSNYARTALKALQVMQARRSITTRAIVDASHGNSGKDHYRQIQVVESVLDSLCSCPDLPIAGVMLESHLQAGRQDFKAGHPFQYGVSITDACLGWDETEALLRVLAASKISF